MIRRRQLIRCEVHGRFLFDVEALEQDIGFYLACCPRCYIERLKSMLPEETPQPQFRCWYPEGEVLQ